MSNQTAQSLVSDVHRDAGAPAEPLRLLQRAQIFPGMAYGCRQSTLVGALRATGKLPPLASVVERIAELTHDVGMALPEVPEDDDSGLIVFLLRCQLSMQQHAKIPAFGPSAIIGLSRHADDDDTREFHFATGYSHPVFTMETIAWLADVANSCTVARARDSSSLARLQADLATLRTRPENIGLPGTNSFYLLQTAHALDIPVSSVTGEVYRYGLGARSRWLSSSLSDRASGLSTRFAKNKREASHILRTESVPVPDHEPCRNEDDAVQIAERFGYPVVVKPADQDQGLGVFAGLKSADSVRRAWREASQVSSQVLVERHHQGDDYRLTVLQDKVIKVMQRRPGGVVGDGTSDIATLVKTFQQSPYAQRKLLQEGRMALQLDDEAIDLLAERHLAPDYVPARDEFVALRRKSNVSTGGTQTIIPVESVHPDNQSLAIRASRILRLDIAGIDLLTTDIGRSWRETGAVICEVNAQPQLGYRATPQLFAQVLGALLQGNGQIDLHLYVLAGHPDTNPADDWLRREAIRLGCQAFSTPSQAWIGPEPVAAGPANGYERAFAVLYDTRVERALIAMTADDVLRNGLPTHRFSDITLVSNPSEQADARELGRVRQMVQLHGTGASLRTIALPAPATRP